MPVALAAGACAAWVWEAIDRAVAAGRTLGEEAITDFFLLELTQRLRGAVRIIDICPREEARLGADWEWWFVDAARFSLPFRVQAKVMEMHPRSPDAPRYPQLHYAGSSRKKFSKGHQTRRLLRRARLDHMLPLYCLYTRFSGAFTPTSFSCAQYGRHDPGFGVGLIGAREVGATPSLRLTDFFAHVHAFECLFEHLTSLDTLEQYCLERWSAAGDSSSFIRRPGELDARVGQAILSDDAPTDLILPAETGRMTVFQLSQDVTSMFGAG